MIDFSFLGKKWIAIAATILGLGIIAFLIYSEANATTEANKAASATQAGAIGSTLGNNITGFFTAISNGIKNIWDGVTGSSTPANTQTSGQTAVGS